MQISPYLTFNGNCEEAFRFYEKVLGGKIIMMMKIRESPAAEHTPPERLDTIMHARLEVGSMVLMGADAPPQFYSTPQGYSVSIVVDDPADADRIFAEFAEGGSVRMQMQQTFWAFRFGMVIDRFGTPWMLNCETPLGG